MWEICEYLDIKYCSCKKRLFAELVFVCKNDIYITKTSIIDKKVTYENNKCLTRSIVTRNR